LIPAFSPMMPYQSFEKIDFEASWGRFDKMLRVNKLDETQSVQHRIFITEAPSWRVATVR
jgi:hypothetical protein